MLCGSSTTSLTSTLASEHSYPCSRRLRQQRHIHRRGKHISPIQTARSAQIQRLNPQEVLERIFISRAFTVYQLTSLILDKLEEAVKNCGAKLVVISDITGFFSDNDIPNEEAQRVYSQIVSYLSSFAKRHQIILIATCLPSPDSKRSSLLQEITCAKASTVLYFSKTPYTREVSLEKHPSSGFRHR